MKIILLIRFKFKYFIKLLYFLCIFFRGIGTFIKTKITPVGSYHAMRQLFVMTNGLFNDIISFYFKIRYPKYTQVNPRGCLGELTQKDVNSIVQKIQQDGYYVHQCKLDRTIVEKLVKYAETTPSSSMEDLFDIRHPLGPIYRFDMQQLFENENIQHLITDQSFMAIAQSYLGCKPILDLVSMWYSVAYDNKKTSEAAQEYHFDMDRIKFLKFFIYLTDVNSDNGPHCYVKGSHIRKPKYLLSDGRKTDQEIYSYYQGDCQEICGKAGTIIIADTRGFHKGKSLMKGCRLILQIEFANSLFGQNYPKVLLPQVKKSLIHEFIKKYPRTYGSVIEPGNKFPKQPLHLRHTNLIIFPDPNQSEQSIYQDLVRVITTLENHPHCKKITLLVNASKFPPHVTQSFTEQLCEEEEGLQISVVGKLSSLEWSALLAQVTARIVLAQEDRETMAQLPMDVLPSCEIDNLGELMHKGAG